VLIYCLDDGAPPERAMEVVHTNTTLYTVPIDLTGNSAAVDQAITDLADWITARSLGVSAA